MQNYQQEHYLYTQDNAHIGHNSPVLTAENTDFFH